MERKILQIDVMEELADVSLMRCVLYLYGSCHTIYLPKTEYETLINKGFFIRDGKTKDSANVINTTNIYKEK